MYMYIRVFMAVNWTVVVWFGLNQSKIDNKNKKYRKVLVFPS